MDRQMSMSSLCLLCVSGWLCVGQLIVDAEPTVTATILTPVADRKEGGVVHMRCVATNLEEDHIVEWRTENPIQSLRFGVYTIAGTDHRFTFQSSQTDGMTIQTFNISNLQMGDTDEYVCNIRDPIPTGGHDILATDRVTLSVLYFPSHPPTCSPDGSITVDTGTEFNMNCSSEGGNLAVTMEVLPNLQTSKTYTWEISNINNTITRSLDTIVDTFDDNVTFKCKISSEYFPMNRSCTIGPIHVTSNDGESSIAVIIGASIAGGVALILILILILIYRKHGACNFRPKPEISNTDRNSNSAHVVFSSGQVEHSHPNSYAGTGFEIPTNAQSNGIYQEPGEVTMAASSDQEPGTSASTSVARVTGQNHDPHYENSQQARMLRRSQLDDSAFDLGNANPAFDSNEPLENPTPRVTPAGKGKPKPRPLKPKLVTQKSIEDNALNNQDGWVSSSPPSQAAPKPPPPHHGVPSSGPQVQPYAKVSVPRNKYKPAQRVQSDDHVVYADLDLKSESSEDESASPPPSNLYASVTKPKVKEHFRK